LESTSNDQLRLIADGTSLLIDATADGSIDATTRHLTTMAERQRGFHPHFFGVTKLNLAVHAVSQDQPIAAIQHALEAIDALEGTSSRLELSAALTSLAYPLAMVGDIDQSQVVIERAMDLDKTEVLLDAPDLADSYMDPDAAESLLHSLGGNPEPGARLYYSIQSAWYHARRKRYAEAAKLLGESRNVEGVFLGAGTARGVTAAYIAVASESEEGLELSTKARDSARQQQATKWMRVAELLIAYCDGGSSFGSTIKAFRSVAPWNITYLADLVCRCLDEFDGSVIAAVSEVALLHPRRWRFVLRESVALAGPGEGLAAAMLLEPIGDVSDIRRLRDFAKRQRKLPGAATLGRQLARKLAEHAIIEDQNRLLIQVGRRQVPGSTVRRKVLALLCFLLTKPDMSSTRDQVLDALWPELDPADALNSLNQTVYFLRRVLEERYVDDLSPGYLHHDSDLIWLDPELVSSRSNDCRRLIKSFPSTPTPNQVSALVEAYHGRFALDFEYEEWAAPYRDWLHASYLEIVERALSDDIETGHYDRGISLARRVLDIDPSAEHVEVSLLRLYRASGAHAAAAEQYSHYANVIRDQLGVEPPPLDSL
jgi:DNA-binding SARP family transcriptional activator